MRQPYRDHTATVPRSTKLLVAPTKTLLCSRGYPKFKLADQEYDRNSNPHLADAMFQRNVPFSNIYLKFLFSSAIIQKFGKKKNNLNEF